MRLLSKYTTLLSSWNEIDTNGLMDNVAKNIAPLSYIFGAVVGLLLIYWLFYVPCNWRKCLDDVGYSSTLREKRISNVIGKKDTINRVRRLRKIGVCELPPPFPNGWYSLMESSHLKRGESKSVYALGEQLVVFRTLDNSVHVMDAYCPHMGANLGVGGRIIGDKIECPFHLWRFRSSDGKCVEVPYSSCAPQSSKLKKWISREVNGDIFVWYHADIEEKPWLLPVVKEIESKNFVCHGMNEFYVNCHIQEIPENGADLAHFRAVHNASILAGGSDPLNSVLQNTGTHHWQAIWKQSEAPTKHIARLTLKHSIEFSKNIHMFKMDVKGEQIGPSFVQLNMKYPTVGCFEVLQTVTPMEPMLQKVVHKFYGPRILGPFMKFAVFGESIMFERDVAIWNHKIFRKQPQLVKEEVPIKLFRNWYSQFYSGSSRSFREVYEHLDW